MRSANELLQKVEEHVGEKVSNRVLRFHIIETLQREIDKHENLLGCVQALGSIKRPGVYDSAIEKPIKKRK